MFILINAPDFSLKQNKAFNVLCNFTVKWSHVSTYTHGTGDIINNSNPTISIIDVKTVNVIIDAFLCFKRNGNIICSMILVSIYIILSSMYKLMFQIIYKHGIQ